MSESGSVPPVVRLSGEIDLAQAPKLQERLEELSALGATTITVDMSEATFLDSVGLGVLVAALNRCREGGGTVRLVVTEPRILKVLRITALENEFEIHDALGDGSADAGRLKA